MMDGFADIEGPVRIGMVWLIALVIVGLLLLAVIGILANRLLKKKAATGPAASGPIQSPLEIALTRLRALRGHQTEMEAEPFTVEVSDIVRDYLERALEVPAREQTSEEFLSALQGRSDMPEALHESMPAFLENCDRVKFARQTLAGEQKEELLNTASTVIESTDSHIRSKQETAEREALGK